jgi:5-methylcytosine-specific restriction endonuclease McrA
MSRKAKRNKDLIDNRRKVLGKCCLCGFNDWEILTFHHKNPSEKSFALSGTKLGSRGVEGVLKELDKCDLLCPNCHVKHEFELNKKKINGRLKV